ncbi:MAG TPA: hypothetical protein VKB89_23920 [Xanthobacteraceae bacterium]|nr:hypothetical protein [Xanthobacteraceae bacterium]
MQQDQAGDPNGEFIHFDLAKPLQNQRFEAATLAKHEFVRFDKLDLDPGGAGDFSQLRLRRIIVETHDLGVAAHPVTPIRFGATHPCNPGTKREIRAAKAKPRKGKADVSFHQIVWAGKMMHRNRSRFEHADDLRHGGRVIENMLEHLIAEAKVKRAVLEWQPVFLEVQQLKPARDFGWGSFRDVPVFVEVAVPIFEHIDAECLVALLQQAAHRLADPAAEIENFGAGRKTQPQPRGGKTQMAFCRSRVIGCIGIDDLFAGRERAGVRGTGHRRKFSDFWPAFKRELSAG